MKLKSWLCACALLLSLSTSGRSACLDEIRQRGTLTAGTGLMGVKPSIWQDQSGGYHGFDWEFMQEIAKRIGIPKIAFVTTEWTSLIPGLQAKRWDIILSDLRGKTLGSTLGTNDSLTAHQMVGDGMAATVKDFNTFGDPFVALKNGQIDAVILDQVTYSGQRTLMSNLRTVGGPIPRRPKPEWANAEAAQSYRLGSEAIAIRQECKDLLAAVNTALTGMDADGTRRTILTQYGVWEPEQVKLTK